MASEGRIRREAVGARVRMRNVNLLKEGVSQKGPLDTGVRTP